MTSETRKKAILKMLESHEEISIQQVALKFGISEITARRDLSSLEERSLIKRTHGGAVLLSPLTDLSGFESKSKSFEREKREICNLASSFIEENDTIYMDCGTTVYYLARYITRFKNLRVITNSLPVVTELILYPQIKVYLIGGELDNSRLAFYGPTTVNLLARYKADKAFIGAAGVSLETGLSCNDEKEASITIKMAEAAKKVFLLCDSSKIEKSSYYNYAELSKVDYLISDKGIQPELIKLYKDNNINIITT